MLVLYNNLMYSIAQSVPNDSESISICKVA